MSDPNPTPAPNSAVTPVELLICTTCRGPETGIPDFGAATNPEPERPGAVLHRALETRDLPEGVTLRAVECLSNCKRGCSIVLRGPGRWTYVYGNLAPGMDEETILDGASRYRDAADGLVPWRERPEHFRKNCIARIPPLPGDPE